MVTQEETRSDQATAGGCPLVIFVRQGAFPIPRITRNLRVCEELGCRTLFLGAHRERDLAAKEIWDGVQIERVGTFYPLAGGKGVFRYVWGLLAFLLSANWRILQLRPAVVHASDIEGALACVAVKLLRPNLRIVFNIHDNLAQRYNVPGWLKSFFLATEGLVARCCDVTLLPDRGRLECMGRFRPRCYRLIPNTPEDPGFVDLEQNVPPLRACLVGWLDWCRGVDVAERLLEKIPAMELVVAGNGPAEVEQHLRGLPRTRYLGFLPHQQVLELMRQCHIVLAFYDPGKEINRYASPNKVGDALAVGRPLLMNSEVALSAELTRTGCVFASPYHDLDAMAETLRKLIADPRLLSDLNRTARGVYEREFHWDRYRAEIREVFVELLSLGTKSSTGRESRLLKERGHAGSPA